MTIAKHITNDDDIRADWFEVSAFAGEVEVVFGELSWSGNLTDGRLVGQLSMIGLSDEELERLVAKIREAARA